MSRKYETPIEVRSLEKLTTDFSYHNELNTRDVFDDLLVCIIYGFSHLALPLKSWRYKEEQTKVFRDMLREWILIMEKQLKIKEWFDPFGDLYMTFTSRYHNTGLLLLACHVHNPGNYLVGEDKAYSCCLMSVVNFVIHGCVGEIIWHNSLLPDSFSGGWRINETLNFTGVPTVREITREEYIIYQKQAKSITRMDKALLRIIGYSGYPFFIQQIRYTSTHKKQILQRGFFSTGKGNSMFLTLRQGQALRVCEKIILALLRYFSDKTLPRLNMDLLLPERKESPALSVTGPCRIKKQKQHENNC